MPAVVSVRVPASVANLGPGLDTLGAAIRMHLDISIEPRRDSIEIMLEGEGADHLPADDTNLVVKSMNLFFDHVARRPPGYAVRVRNPIPLASGLGSSAAAVVGGLVAARALTGRTVSQTDLLDLATQIEDRPHNVMPAFLGGLVVCYRGLHHFRVSISDRLVPIVAVPRPSVPVRDEREGLPVNVALDDARFTASRAALLVAALSSGAGSEILSEAMSDRLHERHRLPLMPETAAVYEQLRVAGLPVALAGAGPSLVVVVARPEVAMRAEQVRRVCRERAAGWRVFVTEWEQEGAAAVA